MAFARASAAYTQAVSNDPNLIARPFLLQWQEGFSGSGILSFSQVATSDAIIIVGVIAITLWVMVWNNSIHERSEQSAIKLSSTLENLLWEISQAAKPLQAKLITKAETRSHVLIDKMEKVITGFETHNQGFERLLERQRLEMVSLANERNKEFQNLQSFVKIFEKAVSELSSFSAQFLGILEDIKNANKTTADSFIKLNELANFLSQLERQIAQLASAINVWGQQQQKAVSELTSTTNTVFGKADSISNAIPLIASAVEGLTQAQNQLVSLFSTQKENTTDWVTELQVSIKETKNVADEMRGSIESLNKLALTIKQSLEQSNQSSIIMQTLGNDIRGSFTLLHTSINQFNEMLKLFGNTFNQSVEHLGSLSTNLPEVASKLAVLNKINEDLIKLQSSIKEMNILLSDAGNAMEATHYSNMEFATVLEREMSNLRSYFQRKI